MEGARFMRDVREVPTVESASVDSVFLSVSRLVRENTKKSASSLKITRFALT
jgi:hypothetical protein